MEKQNPFTDPGIVAAYEDWYHTTGYQADIQEKALLQWLLSGFPRAHSLLEIGCGTGHFTRWFCEMCLQVVGLDLSRQMLDKARKLNSPDLLQGDALMLPFPSRSFDLAVLITTLEFLPDPLKALSEALRVAQQGLILGVLNAQSRFGRQYKLEGGPIWEDASFYTPDKLKGLIRRIAGEKARVVWRTTLLPFWRGSLPLPCGGFIGMSVKI